MKIKHLIKNALKNLLKTPANWLVVSSTVFARRVDEVLSGSSALMDNAGIAAKLFPYQGSASRFAFFPRRKPVLEKVPFESPPSQLMEGYGPDVDRYLRSGREDFGKMVQILEKNNSNLSDITRALDFGCAAGRLIRHFPIYRSEQEILGVDISGNHIRWAQANLTPPYQFITTTTFPSLPFEDGYFDLVYAGSVFTHIADLADAWFLELRRILKPKGKLYITLHDRDSIRVLREKHPQFFLTRLVEDYQTDTGFLDQNFGVISISRHPKDAMVFYDASFVQDTWGQFMKLLDRVPESYGYQSGYLFEKQLPRV